MNMCLRQLQLVLQYRLLRSVESSTIFIIAAKKGLYSVDPDEMGHILA